MKQNNQSFFKYEQSFIQQGFDFVIGIDEVGRGPLAGPVVACAVAQKNYDLRFKNYDKQFDLIKDSKMLSAKQREKLFDFIHENFHVGVGICDHKTIDRMNVLQATYLAAKKALSDLFKKVEKDTPKSLTATGQARNNNQTNSKFKIQNSKFIILFDGNKIIPNLSFEQRAIVNGDKIVKSISAASIIAKVTRDRIMLQMHQKYPHYHFHKHKGYGTKLHMEKLQRHGPCKIHRQSFRPVKILTKR
ncbi:MAG: ribonuclease HII [Candidatus Moranbacteria bacterium]|nr:ribonuclease HII [Candidatus Moranbacteria bacterium]